MKFVDLHLCLPIGDAERAERLIAKSAELGYSRIGVPLPPSVKEETVKPLRQISTELGLDFVTRLDLNPRSSGDLLVCLRKFRRSFEVVSVTCNSKAVARHAARDRRVDLLCFPSVEPRKRFFDRAEAQLASESSAALEVNVAQILSSIEAKSNVAFLSRLRREVAIAKSFDVPVVFSSGTSELLFLRKPQDCAALALLFDVESSFALEALSTNPTAIIERNRARQSLDYAAPGVRIVKEARKP